MFDVDGPVQVGCVRGSQTELLGWIKVLITATGKKDVA